MSGTFLVVWVRFWAYCRGFPTSDEADKRTMSRSKSTRLVPCGSDLFDGLYPQVSVQAAVADRFGQVHFVDVVVAGDVRDGARDS